MHACTHARARTHTQTSDDAQLAVIVKQRFEVLIDVERFSHHAHVEGTERSHVFEVLVLDQLDNNLLFGLDLEQLLIRGGMGRGLRGCRV